MKQFPRNTLRIQHICIENEKRSLRKKPSDLSNSDPIASGCSTWKSHVSYVGIAFCFLLMETNLRFKSAMRSENPTKQRIKRKLGERIDHHK